MLIDWFTVGAQALNFVVLVWLMKRYLYQPILNAIDARENRIAAELADADTKKAEAQKERVEFQRKNEQFDQKRATLLLQASNEADAQRQRLLDEAREAADALLVRSHEVLSNEAHDLSQAIAQQTLKEVLAIARKALSDLATTGLEERMSEVFIQRLRAMNSDEIADMETALQAAPHPAVVRSAFELPLQQRRAIQNALNETFSDEVVVRFETAPDLVSGIELATTGQKLAWSIDDYLGSLEKSITALVGKRAQTKQEIQPEPTRVGIGEANERTA